MDPKLFTSQRGSGSKTRSKIGSESGSEKNCFGSTTLLKIDRLSNKVEKSYSFQKRNFFFFFFLIVKVLLDNWVPVHHDVPVPVLEWSFTHAYLYHNFGYYLFVATRFSFYFSRDDYSFLNFVPFRLIVLHQVPYSFAT
jgi:hypothetical protein